MTTFAELNLHADLMRAIDDQGFTSPTPVQEQSIPHILEGIDVMACAQTGTGKTAAFTLPSLHKLLTTEGKKPEAKAHNSKKLRNHGPRVLVLTPTRELAAQVMENIRSFASGTKLKTAAIIGGVPYGPQFKTLERPLDIMVATPGRLIDHMKEGKVDFSRVEILVLDEADRMLDMGFQKPVESIIEQCSEKRQTLLFSATFDKGVERIADQLMNDPVRVTVSSTTEKHENIEQFAITADDMKHKMDLLVHLLQDAELWQAIVFTATKRAADQLSAKLFEMGFAAAALHGDMRQNVRKRTIQKMHENKLRVLVATDVAARGLDVKGLSHVINFDMPQVAEDYVHRIGRTGRGGEKGIAFSLVGPKDFPMMREVERLTESKIERTEIEGLESKMSESEFHKASRQLAGNSGRKGGAGRGNNKPRSKPSKDKGKPKPRGERKFSNGPKTERKEGPKFKEYNADDSKGKARDNSRGNEERKTSERKRFSRPDDNAQKRFGSKSSGKRFENRDSAGSRGSKPSKFAKTKTERKVSKGADGKISISGFSPKPKKKGARH